MLSLLSLILVAVYHTRVLTPAAPGAQAPCTVAIAAAGHYLG